jgi:hypothetical protein
MGWVTKDDLAAAFTALELTLAALGF